MTHDKRQVFRIGLEDELMNGSPNTMIDSTDDFASYLAPGERVLWQGQGRRRLSATSASGLLAMAIVAALALVFLAIFRVVPISSGGQDDRFVAIFVPLILVVIGLSVGLPLFLVGRQRGNARYAVTSLSILIASQSTWSGKRVTLIPLKNLAQVMILENRDGTGTLIFGSSPYAVNARYASSWLVESAPAFWNIENLWNVYQLIRKQMDERAAM